MELLEGTKNFIQKGELYGSHNLNWISEMQVSKLQSLATPVVLFVVRLLFLKPKHS